MADTSSSSFELDARLHVSATEQGQTRQFPIGVPTVEGMELVIGRSRSVDLTIHDDFISNKHLKIVFRAGEHWLEDLGSTHGTQLNGTPVKKAVKLATGDVVTLGKSKFEYRCTRRSLEVVGSIAEFADEPAAQPATKDAPAKAEPAHEDVTMNTGATLATAPNGAKATAAAKAAEAQASAGQAGKTQVKAAAPAPATKGKEGKREGGAGFGTLALAALGIAGILALVCYLAWQVFFAGK